METFDVPGLDISVLTNPKDKTNQTNSSQETSATQGSQFPIRDSFQNTNAGEDSAEDIDPKTGKPKEKPAEKKPLTLDKSQILLKEEEDNQNQENLENKESPVKAIAEFLKSKGILSYEDTEFKDEDDFISEQVSKSVTKGVEDYKSSLPEEIKNLVSLYEEGVPIGALLEKEREIFEYSQVNPDKLKDDKELQKTLVHNFYVEMGWEKDEIVEKLQELEDSAILEKESRRALTKLTNLQNQQKQDLISTAQRSKQEREIKYREQVLKLQETIKNTKEFIPGITLTELDKKAVLEGITKFSNGKNKVMEFLDKPENYMLISYIANALKGDWSKVKKTATTQAMDGIRNSLNSQPTRSAFSGVDTSIMKKAIKLT